MSAPTLTTTPASIRAGDTATWLVGRAYIDVQFDGPGGHVVSSETIHVKVLQDVTIG